MKTGTFIKTRRDELDLSLQDVASRLTLNGYPTNKASVWQWENEEKSNRNAPIEKEEFRVALARAFEMDINVLVKLVGWVKVDDERSPEALRAASLVDQMRPDQRPMAVKLLETMLEG